MLARMSPSFINPNPSGSAAVIGHRPPLETLVLPAKPGVPRVMVKRPALEQGIWETPPQAEKFMKTQQLSENIRGLRWEASKTKSLKIGKLGKHSIG
jgi:hypothetical protein